ncbi:MAG: monothiol bacilliredoxin BrxC family protein [Deinococcota bacterium]
MDVLKSKDEISQVIAHSHKEPVFIYKHSATCPYNARAQGEVVLLKHDYPIYGVVVQYARDVSDELATSLAVEH